MWTATRLATTTSTMTTSSEPAPLIAVVGPTATGKSELALRICEALHGEVVNADALQLYRGLDIGTAKLSEPERRGIRHHQLDVLEVTQEASVAAYQRQSRADVAAIRGRGGLPVLVGGSGLYVRAALDDLRIPPMDPEVRARWDERARAEGPGALYAVLRDRDPVAADAIEPGNTRRIVRALEVIELTGEPFSATLPSRRFIGPTLVLGLDAPAKVIDERIDARVLAMWDAGLLDEVRLLEHRGLRAGRTASKAIGYAQALAELDGELTTGDAVQATQIATRRLARRQRSWFRPDPRITWFAASEDGLHDALAWVRNALQRSGAGQCAP